MTILVNIVLFISILFLIIFPWGKAKSRGFNFPVFSWRVVFTILGILFLIFCFRNCSQARKDKLEARIRLAEIYSKVSPPTKEHPVTRTLDIPEQGLPVYLSGAWHEFPIGGKITITNPNGEILPDEPGTVHNYGWQPNGIFIFRADPPGAQRKVTIVN